jgi:pimeloyl-ACP methyl ester carboxylesterase
VALVFLHGIGTGPEAWDEQVEYFAPSREVLCPPVAPELRAACAEIPAGVHDLCGLSWGALVALTYALDHEVDRLVVTAGFAFLPARLRALQTVFGHAVRVVPRAPHELSAPMLQGRSFDLRERSHELQLPVLVLCGARDRANLGLSRRLADLLPNARFETVPDAGHVANLDNPDAFNRLVEEFLC